MQTDGRRSKSNPTYYYHTYLHCDVQKLGHLVNHFEIVGGDKAVIDASNDLNVALSNILQCTRNALESKAGESKFSATTYLA